MLQQEPRVEQPLFQDGRGIDHLIIAIRNLEVSTVDFSRLGFTMKKGGRHPTGTENTIARFQDDTYLELLGLYDPSRDEVLSAFLEKHEGGTAVGLNTESVEKTLAYLKTRGISAETGEGTIKLESMTNPPPAFWRWIGLKEGTFLSDTTFLIEYTKARAEYRQQHPQEYGEVNHPNTAKRLSSVWIAVRDVQTAGKSFERAGFTRSRQLSFPQMDGKAAEFNAGHGTILLLDAPEPKGKTARFIAQRGEGVIGASIEVTNIQASKDYLQKSFRPETYQGAYGESLMVPPEHAHGIYLEMYQIPGA